MTLEALYEHRLARYVTAMRCETPDRIPIRPFAAEFTAKYAGYTCQEVVHDYQKAFDAAAACARDFEWDAVVPNMVYVWTGLAQAAGLRYYSIPGVGTPADAGFNYIEPSEDAAFMREDEYDALIADPTGFLYDTWLPRASTEVCRVDAPATRRHSLALVKSAMAMLSYFHAFGRQIERLRRECGTPSAIAGIFKAPLDILADKLRGYVGLTMDMFTQPEKVLAACEALMPHLCHVGLSTSDPAGLVPIGFWMHRGCVPFVTPAQFNSHYWPTLRPIIEEFWKAGRQTLFYAEGNWNWHLPAFRELPQGSIVYHVDRDDLFDVKRKIGDRFCLSGGIPNMLLSFGQPAEVREFCRRVIREAAVDGGYVADASAIMQNDTSIENLRAMTDVFRQEGGYSRGRSEAPSALPPAETEAARASRAEVRGLGSPREGSVRPGVCYPWEEKVRELPELRGDRELLRRIWEDVDALGATYIWQLLLSF